MTENNERNGSSVASAADGGPVMSLALIKHHSGTVGLDDPRRAYLEAHLDAHGAMSHVVATCKGTLVTNRVKDGFDKALRESGRSKEILYYGRIFRTRSTASRRGTSRCVNLVRRNMTEKEMYRRLAFLSLRISSRIQNCRRRLNQRIRRMTRRTGSTDWSGMLITTTSTPPIERSQLREEVEKEDGKDDCVTRQSYTVTR